MIPTKTSAPYPATSGKTSLVDRMNVSIHLRKYIKLFTRRWIIIFLLAGLSLSYSIYKAQITPNVYQAYSKLGIAPRIATGITMRAEYQEELQTYYESQIGYMLGDAVLGKVREKLKDYQTSSGIPPTASPSASRGSGSTLVMLVTGNDFDYARKFAQVWANEFITFKNNLKVDKIDEAVASTRVEVARYEEMLNKTREKVQDFLKQHNIGSAKDTGDAAQKQLERLESEQLNIRTLRQRLENKTAEELANAGSAEGRGIAASKTGPSENQTKSAEGGDPLEKFIGGSQYADLKLQLKTKESEREQFRKTLQNKHPHMAKLDKEIARLQEQLDFFFDLIKERRTAQIKSWKNEEDALQPLIDAQKSIVYESRQTQLQFERLKDDENGYKTVLEGLRRQLQSIDLTPSKDEQLVPHELGAGSPAPIAPDRRKMILSGLLVGLGIGFAIIYFLHRLDDRLELAEDIEAELEEPVLGQVPHLTPDNFKDGRLFITHLDQHNMFAESLRGVRSAVMFGPQEKKQVMLITSAVPGDGKTTFTVNFATTLARAGNRVLLVDADLRRGNTHLYFGMSREPGLTEVLVGEMHWSDVCQKTELDNLHVINTGRLPPNPGELLISPVMQQVIAEAREEYDHVLFDCPPLTSIDDTFCLLNHADGLLFIIKAGHTSMRFAKNALAAVRQRGAAIIGIVLNGITTDHPSYYYYYYYHEYYKTTPEAPGGGKRMRNEQPASKMASRHRKKIASIDQAARSEIGEPAAPSQITKEEQRKAEEFKARRVALRARQGLADTTKSQAANPNPSVETAPPDDTGTT